MRILAGFYTNNAVRPVLLKSSLQHFEAAAAQADVIPVVSSWHPIENIRSRNLISQFQLPGQGHLNILLQLHHIVYATPDSWDYFAFCEHDCLYPEHYFSDLCQQLEQGEYPGVASENHIGLRPGGYSLCEPGIQPLFAMVLRRDVLLRSLQKKLAECVLNGWCCIEPDDRSGWLIRKSDRALQPIIHVNMETTATNHHLTSHHNSYSMVELLDTWPLWGPSSQFSFYSAEEITRATQPLIDQTKCQIVDAHYGDFSSNRTVSFMPVLRKQHFSGIIQANNSNAGCDPAPGIVKTLRLQIDCVDSNTSCIEVTENSVFRL